MGLKSTIAGCMTKIILVLLFLLTISSVGWAAPTVTGVQPMDGSFPPPTIAITATFSESMDPTTITPGTFNVSKYIGIKATFAGGEHTVALRNDGTVVAWGNNDAGQCNVPTGLSGVATIAAGGVHTVALKSDGTVVAWGRNTYGESSVPEGLSGVIAISAGGMHTLALKSDGTVVAWGSNTDYYGTYMGQSTVPAGLSGVVAIGAGGYHSVALKSDGTVVAWGRNEYGQGAVPDGLSDVSAIAVGDFHNVALKNNGTVVAWGYDGYGQCSVPTELSGVTAVSAGGHHTLALKSDNTVVAWGSNTFYSDFYTGQSNVPSGLSGVVAISAGGWHSVALKNDGTMVAWGYNNHGQSTVPVTSPYETAVAGNVVYDNATLTATFTPSAPLEYGTTYLGTINTGARNIVGGPLEADYRWKFVTELKTTAVVTLFGLSQTYDGTPKAATATTTPAGLVVDITYNGSATPPTTAGDYAVVATINDPNYQGSASGTLNIAKAVATISLGDLNQTYDGASKTATAMTSPAGLAVDITYNGSTTPPTTAGDYTVVATISDPNYQGSVSGTLNIAKAAATITLGNLSQIYDGKPKPVQTPTAPIGLTVVTTYNGSAIPPKAVGSYAIVSTINDPNYQGSASGILIVSKMPATITLGNLSQTYDGTPKAVTATTTPAGLTVNLTYNGSATPPTTAGDYVVEANISDPNYQGTATGTLSVAKVAATITLGDLTQTYDGTPKAVSAMTNPAGLAVAFTYDGSATVPTDIGIYAVAATISDPNYQGNAGSILVIANANPQPATITLGNLTQTYDGTPKAATATTDPAGLAVTFTYDGSATVPTNAGSYTVAATIRDPSYQGSASGTLNVAKANQTISFTLPATARFRNSVPLTATATSNLPVTYVVTSGPGVIVGTDLSFTGMGFVVVTASQSGDSNYNAAADVQGTIEAVTH